MEKLRAKAVKDESDSIQKVNKANLAINKSRNQTTINNKLREIKRENDKIQLLKSKQADLLKKIASKNNELNKAISDLAKARQKEQNRIFEEQEKKISEFKIQQNNAIQEVATSLADDIVKEYDVFISHSADDKDSFVEELASALKNAGVTIWYDSDNIGWGKSIRQEIDKGLAHSKYGIVVISPSFIAKHWTNYELDGILTKEGITNAQMLLPIWHNITADQVQKYSYSLANKLALNTAINTIDEIVDKVKKLL